MKKITRSAHLGSALVRDSFGKGFRDSRDDADSFDLPAMVQCDEHATPSLIHISGILFGLFLGSFVFAFSKNLNREPMVLELYYSFSLSLEKLLSYLSPCTFVNRTARALGQFSYKEIEKNISSTLCKLLRRDFLLMRESIFSSRILEGRLANDGQKILLHTLGISKGGSFSWRFCSIFPLKKGDYFVAESST
jgi:hypothetical protein